MIFFGFLCFCECHMIEFVIILKGITRGMIWLYTSSIYIFKHYVNTCRLVCRSPILHTRKCYLVLTNHLFSHIVILKITQPSFLLTQLHKCTHIFTHTHTHTHQHQHHIKHIRTHTYLHTHTHTHVFIWWHLQLSHI